MFDFTRRTLLCTLAFGLCGASLAQPTYRQTQDYNLPHALALATSETGTSHNARATVLGNLLKDYAGVNLRILLAANGENAETWEGAGYTLPILLTMSEKDQESVYQLTEFFCGHFGNFKSLAPKTEGFVPNRQDLDMSCPTTV